MNIFGIHMPAAPSLFSIILVIIMIGVNDMAWALYIRRVGQGLAVKAGFWAAMIYGSGIVLTISALQNYWLIPVACAASFCGTMLTVTLDHRKQHETK